MSDAWFSHVKLCPLCVSIHMKYEFRCFFCSSLSFFLSAQSNSRLNANRVDSMVRLQIYAKNCYYYECMWLAIRTHNICHGMQHFLINRKIVGMSVRERKKVRKIESKTATEHACTYTLAQSCFLLSREMLGVRWNLANAQILTNATKIPFHSFTQSLQKFVRKTFSIALLETHRNDNITICTHAKSKVISFNSDPYLQTS